MSDKLGKMVTNVIEVEKNGVKVVIKQQYNKEINDINIDFSGHDKVFEDKIADLQQRIRELIKEKDEYKRKCNNFGFENQELKQRIAELEEKNKNLVNMINELQLEKAHIDCDLYDANKRIAELESKETETCENEPKISGSTPSMEWYDNRHQSDCIEINRLNTTIDVLIHKVECLRQIAGLE